MVISSLTHSVGLLHSVGPSYDIGLHHQINSAGAVRTPGPRWGTSLNADVQVKTRNPTNKVSAIRVSPKKTREN